MEEMTINLSACPEWQKRQRRLLEKLDNLKLPFTTKEFMDVLPGGEKPFTRGTLLHQGDSPDRLAMTLNHGIDLSVSIQTRNMFIDKYQTWFLPSRSTYAYLRKEIRYTKILDCYAGRAYFSYGFKKLYPELEVVATDDQSWDKLADLPPFYPITKKCCLQACRGIQGYSVFVIWPPFRDEHLHALAKLLLPHNELFFIGEYGACCGNSESLSKLEVEEMDIPFYRFLELRDHVFRVTGFANHISKNK